LPVENVPTFKANLQKLPKSQRVTWQRYTVQEGDSLNKIATTFHTNVPLLKQVNKLDDEVIHPDDILFIPESTHRLSSDVIDSARKNVDVEDEKRPGPQKVTHVVKAGETVATIAKKYHVTTSALSFWNGLKKGQVLTKGQSLDLWLKEEEVPKQIAPAKQDLGQHFKATEPLQIKYTVQSGDSLEKIAYYFDTNTVLIKQLNHLITDLLSIGQELIVVPHALPTVRTGQAEKSRQMVYIVEKDLSLSDLAKKFNITSADIMKWNTQLSENASLRSGDIVFLWQS
jgi:membrane-bound lytic murein transglycosylase D